MNALNYQPAKGQGRAWIRRIRLINWHGHENATLDVVGDMLAVIGENGSGKSLILDAIDWALFPTSGKVFNAAAFTAPPTGQQGAFGRNVLRAFGAWQADLAFQRQFRVTEKLGLRFRAECFNIFNHPNFGSPNNTLTSPLFGQSTQTLASSLGSGGANGGFNPLYQIGGPRSIQLALKMEF